MCFVHYPHLYPKPLSVPMSPSCAYVTTYAYACPCLCLRLCSQADHWIIKIVMSCHLFCKFASISYYPIWTLLTIYELCFNSITYYLICRNSHLVFHINICYYMSLCVCQCPLLVYMPIPMSLQMPLHIISPAYANAFAVHTNGAFCHLLALI